MPLDNWTPLNAPANNYPRYSVDQLEAAANNAEQSGELAAANELRKAAQIERDAELLRKTGGKGREFAPLSGMSGPERFVRGAGLAGRNIGRGAAEMAGVDVGDKSPEKARRDEFLMRSPAGAAGNIAGNVAIAAPTALIPGANTVTGAALTGAALGALQPTGEQGFGANRVKNTVAGGAGGAAGGAIAKGMGRIFNPRNSAAAQELMDSGVDLTPGQAMGGMANRIEEKAVSIPFIGDDILNARMRARSQFNTATLNKVLAPIRQKVSTGGREGIDQAHDIISKTYDQILKNNKGIKLDDMFIGQLDEVMDMAKTLPESRQKQLFNILREKLQKNVTQSGNMSGESFKRTQSELRRLGTQYRKSPDMDQRQLGDALSQVAKDLTDVLKRSDPARKAALDRADEAYMGFIRVQRAATSLGAEGGEFSPSQLLNAVKATDRSMNKGAFARGDAPFESWAENAKGIISDRVPNSGTADRFMNAAAMLGGGYGAATNLPATLALGLGGKAASKMLYSPTGTRAAAAMLARRPDYVRQIGQGFGNLALPSGVAGSLSTQ